MGDDSGSKSGSRSASAGAPDVLGDTNRVNMVLAALDNVQRQRFDLQLRQQTEGHGDADPSGFTGGDGQPITYTERFAAFDAAEKRLLDANAELIPEVERVVEQRQQQEAAARAAAAQRR